MAPKSLPPAAKQALIVQWFQRDSRAYSIKELEAYLPAVASIHSIQVKEYIQTLTDENIVRVEKIGSSNWYWSFTSDAKKQKTNVLTGLSDEEENLRRTIESTKGDIIRETAARKDVSDGKLGRKDLLQVQASLNGDINMLAKQLEEYEGNDPAEVMRKTAETKYFRESAERWTDNLESIESYLIKRTGDKTQIRKMMEGFCNSEYVAGEGFRDF